jgi:hypothetical protein
MPVSYPATRQGCCPDGRCVSELATQGRLAVINAEGLVVLPETVEPEHIGRLGLFKFEAEADGHDERESVSSVL